MQQKLGSWGFQPQGLRQAEGNLQQGSLEAVAWAGPELELPLGLAHPASLLQPHLPQPQPASAASWEPNRC